MALSHQGALNYFRAKKRRMASSRSCEMLNGDPFNLSEPNFFFQGLRILALMQCHFRQRYGFAMASGPINDEVSDQDRVSGPSA